MLIKPEIRFILDFLKGAARHMAISFQIPAAFRKGRPGQWLDLGTWLPPNISNLRADWIKSGETWTLNRIDAEKSGFSRKDVMSSIISAIDPETNQQMTTPEILTEAYVLVTAGGDTTSTAISSTLFYLSRNSVAYAKATAEVRSKFSFEEQISMGPSLNSCAYLRACIDEAMRMSSPVCAPLWRETGPGGATVCGNYVPQGLSCAVGTYAVHHNPAYYADPFRYFPERWLAGEHVTPETLECAKASFSPFSVGPRNCAGKSLAYLEMMLTLARLLWLADIRIPQGNVGHIGEGHSKNEYGRHRPEEFQVYDTFGSGKRGPMLQFKKRTDKIT
ncbi:hypothetical protein MMC20_001155 [Loxospora ochrophaea]|nr:hypothetical protein [Loxospora ochrophaea]